MNINSAPNLSAKFNNNIRCIEILSANELEIFFNRLITT